MYEDILTLLLSCRDCKELAIISEEFPKPILEVTHANRLCETGSSTYGLTATQTPATGVAAAPTLPTSPQLREFKDVLVTKEDLRTMPLRMMVGPPMKIHLRDDAKPFAIHNPPILPLTYREPAKAELDSMVAQGVITPAGEEDPSP